jgi:hypothetical protein
MMELVSLHHGGHLITPHRAPLRGGIQSRPTPGEASPAMEDTTADAHGWGGGLQHYRGSRRCCAQPVRLFDRTAA